MLLSVVVVLRRHQAWIRPCLRSVLDQEVPSGTGLELVVVDDASPDHGPRIAAEVAAADPRVRVVALEAAQGYAAARAAGTEAAAGEHVWFLEASDLVVPGSLAAVLTALAEPDAPDVLALGEVQRDLYGVDRPAPGPVTRPVLRDLVGRRPLVREAVQEQGDGRYADVPLAAALLARAARVGRSDGPVVVHRQLPRRVLRQWADGDAFDVFPAYDRALAELAAAGADQAVRRVLVELMLGDQRGLLAELPSARRAAFFARMAQAWAEHGAHASEPVGRAARLERRALETGSYPAFLAVRRARLPRPRRLAATALRRLPRNRRKARELGLEAYYAAARRLPLDPRLAVFTAYWGAAYSCNPRAIYEKARELAPWLHPVWVVKPGSEHVLPAGVEHVVQGSRAYYRLMARATYFVNNVNFPNDIVKRPGQVHVQTHHGTPLKTMGLDLVHARHSSLGLNFRRLMKRVERWDYSISANAFTTEIWERVYPSGTYESLETGYPRNDVLATATDEHRERVRAELGIGPGQRAVLYTPTHREYAKEYVAMLDVDALAAALGPDHVVLMRAHYFYGGVPASSSAGVLDVADHPSIEDLSIASDVLVTDYSSLMFDYAVLDRPIVIFAPDWDTYRTERGVYFDLMAEPPGPVATTQEDLAEVLRSGRADDAASAALRAAFRAKYCSLEDGRAAERVVRRLWPDRSGPRPAETRTGATTTAAPAVKEDA